MAEAWAEAVVAERRRARETLVAKARVFVEDLARSGGLVAAVVYGSVARGDFNVWSDVDLLLVLRDLPEREPERLTALVDRLPAGVQVVAWTPDDLARAYERGNPIAREAVAAGVVLYGEQALRAVSGRV